MSDSIDDKIKKIEQDDLVVPIDILLQNINKLPSLNEEQCLKMLTTIPYKLEEIENKITSLEIILDEAEAKQKRLEAQFKLKSIELKQRKELLSEGDRTAWVMCQPEVIQAQDDVFKVRKQLMELQPLHDRLDRNFIAVRKIAGMLNDTSNVLGRSQNYV